MPKMERIRTVLRNLGKRITLARFRRAKTEGRVTDVLRQTGFKPRGWYSLFQRFAQTDFAKRMAQGIGEVPIGGAPTLYVIDLALVGGSKKLRRKELSKALKKLFIDKPELRKRLVLDVCEALYENHKFLKEGSEGKDFPVYDKRLRETVYGVFDELYDKLHESDSNRKRHEARGKEFLRDLVREMLSDYDFLMRIPLGEREKRIRALEHVLGGQSGRIRDYDVNQIDFVRDSFEIYFPLLEKCKKFISEADRMTKILGNRVKIYYSLMKMLALSEMVLRNNTELLALNYPPRNFEKLIKPVLEAHGETMKSIRIFQRKLVEGQIRLPEPAPQFKSMHSQEFIEMQFLPELVKEHISKIKRSIAEQTIQ